MKNCNIVMEKYLSLDKGERIPLLLTIHLFICKNCRSEVRYLKKAESVAASNVQVGIKDQSIAAVMQRIYSTDKPQKNPVSLLKWILGGLGIAVVFIMFAILAKNMEWNALKLCAYIELAMIVTIYSAFFIRSNMDFFVKLINTKIPNSTFQEGLSD